MHPRTRHDPRDAGVKGNSARYGYIDGLRGLAALWVVFYHLWGRFYPGLTPGLPNGTDLFPPPFPTDLRTAIGVFLFGFGYTGVTLFFVLSGFCIHLPQARKQSYTLRIGEFARRRFWRLYPAYAASIVVAIVAMLLPKVLLLLLRGRTFDWVAEAHLRDALINAAFLQQVWPAALDSINIVYWTLVFEVQFYLGYPALLWAMRRTSLATVGAILLAAELWFAFAPPSIPNFFLTRYFEWYLGVLAAEAVVRPRDWTPARLPVVCAVAGLAAGVGVSFHPVLFPLRHLFFAIGYFGVVLVVARSRARNPLAALLNWRAVVGLGVFSYSLYLIHVPVVDLVWTGLDRLLATGSRNPALVHRLSLIAIPLSIGFAYLFYRMFERPYLERGKRARGAEALPVAIESAAL